MVLIEPHSAATLPHSPKFLPYTEKVFPYSADNLPLSQDTLPLSAKHLPHSEESMDYNAQSLTYTADSLTIAARMKPHILVERSLTAGFLPHSEGRNAYGGCGLRWGQRRYCFCDGCKFFASRGEILEINKLKRCAACLIKG